MHFTIDLHVHDHRNQAENDLLNAIAAGVRTLLTRTEAIKMTQAELAEQLTAVSAQLTKIGTETTTLLARVADLEAAIANAPVSPEVQTAFDAVKASAQAADDLVPDAPHTP